MKTNNFRNPYIFYLLISLFLPTLAFSQNEESKIKQSINQFFDGMRANDSTMIKEVLHNDCTLNTIVKTKEGDTKLQKGSMQDFIKTVGTKRENFSLDERLSSFTIQIDGEMAVAWTPYQFYLNNNFSHCGVNVFTLMKQKDGWKIVSIIDTRRKDKCE